MGLFDSLSNTIQGVGQGLGINTPGHGSVYNSIVQNINQGSQRINQSLAPVVQNRNFQNLGGIANQFNERFLGQRFGPAVANVASMAVKTLPQTLFGPAAAVTGNPFQGVANREINTFKNYLPKVSNTPPKSNAERVAGQVGLATGTGMNIAAPMLLAPSADIPAAIENAASPVARLAGSSLIRGGENAAFGAVQDYGQGKGWRDIVHNVPGNVAIGAGLNTAFSPKITSDVLGELSGNLSAIRNQQAVEQSVNGLSKVISQTTNPAVISRLLEQNPNTKDLFFGANKQAVVSQLADETNKSAIFKTITDKMNPPQVGVKYYEPGRVSGSVILPGQKPVVNPATGNTMPPTLTDAYKQTAESNPSLVPKPADVVPITQNLKDAADTSIRGMSAITQQIQDIGGNLARFLDRKGFNGSNPNETALLHDSIEHPQNLTNNLGQSGNPKNLQAAVNLTNQNLKMINDLRGQAGITNQLPNFFPHDFQTNNPTEAEKALQSLQMPLRDAKNFIAGSNKTRVFQDINQAQSIKDVNGNQIFQQNPNAAETIRNYTTGQSTQAGNKVLTDTLAKEAPGHIQTDSGLTLGPDGKPMVQLKAPGLMGTTVSQALYDLKQIKGLEPSTLAATATGKAVNAVTQAGKKVALALNEFHPVKETINMAGNLGNNPTGTVSGLYQGLAAFASKDYAHNLETASFQAKNYPNWTGSLSEAMAKMGTTTMGSGSEFQGGIDKVPLLGTAIKAQEEATFTRMIRAYKAATTEAFLKGGGVPGTQEANQIGSQINNIFGGQNQLVNGSDKNVNWLARQVLLAQDFTTGKVKNLISAGRGIIPGVANAGDAYARNNLIGTVLATSLAAELGKRLTTGKFDASFKDLVNNSILNPNFPVPANLFNPSGDTRQRIAKITGSNVSDVYRAVTDPKQFIQARLSTPISLVSRALTNQNYYGKQISNPGDSLPQKALNLATTTLPSGVTQAGDVLSGKTAPAAAALNSLGLRVSISPNDPSILTAQGRSDYAKTLPQNLAQQYTSLHPATTDSSGMALPKEGTLASQQNALNYLNHPEFLAADTAISSKAGGQQDPFWSLTPDQQHMVLLQRSMGVVKSGDVKPLYNAAWYQQFKQNQSSFYASLPTQTNATKPPVAQSAQDLQTANPNLTPSQATTQAKRIALGLSPTAPSPYTTIKNTSAKITPKKVPGVTLKTGGGRKGGKVKAMKVAKMPKVPKQSIGFASGTKPAKTLTIKQPKYKPFSMKGVSNVRPRSIKLNTASAGRKIRLVG